MGSNDRPDVVVAGGGVAGLAAAICLSRRGLRVVCIDPEPPPRIRVGESLDWSAPALLGEIGLDRDDLIAAGAGTFKREIRAATPTGELMVGRPWKWLQRWPLRFEEMTLHVDRGGFDLLLQKQALSVGVELVVDNVVGVRFEGDRMTSFVTSSGERFEAAWFIDASGRRRLIGRSAGINRRKWGSPRMALWTESAAPSLDFDGTMLYLDDRGEALVWGWEIPIAQDRRSTGVAIPLNGFQALHRADRTAGEILADHLAVLRPSPATSFAHNESVRTRSYQPYVNERVSGEN